MQLENGDKKMSKITNLFILENTDSRNRGFTGKELIGEKIPVVLDNNAADDIKTAFAQGEKVYVLPLYSVVVGAGGEIDVDFSDNPDEATSILVIGETSKLAGQK
jgi:hypothetical protein